MVWRSSGFDSVGPKEGWSPSVFCLCLIVVCVFVWCVSLRFLHSFIAFFLVTRPCILPPACHPCLAWCDPRSPLLPSLNSPSVPLTCRVHGENSTGDSIMRVHAIAIALSQELLSVGILTKSTSSCSARNRYGADPGAHPPPSVVTFLFLPILSSCPSRSSPPSSAATTASPPSCSSAMKQRELGASPH